METLDNQDLGSAKRPTFLTVLCILTFIGSGLVILMSFAKKDPVIEEYASYYYWVTIALSVGTLFGAIQMWKLKKMGLYIWTLCELAAIVLVWVVIKGVTASLLTSEVNAQLEATGMQATANAMVEGVMNTVLMLYTIIPGIFVLLYWLNAKHLK